MMALLELALAQPVSTTTSTTVPSSEDFSKNRAQNFANIVGSIEPSKQYIEAGVPAILVDMLSAPVKGASILQKLIGSLKSKRKFPIAETIPDIGIRGKNAHSAIDNVIARNDFLNSVKKHSDIKKHPISTYLPDILPTTVKPNNPYDLKMILRNDPAKKRLKK